MYTYVEYLSPEQVFNLGHDYAVDLWSLGVVMYEMFLGVTPFAPKKADNLTELFANIAASKKGGVVVPPALEEKSKSKAAPELIAALLTYEAIEYVDLIARMVALLT
jgi:serine/threonine protein kinase